MSQISQNSLYQAVESALDLMNCDVGAAECHGMLCGMLCNIEFFDPSAWLAHVMGYETEISVNDLGTGHALIELLNTTIEGFSSEDFSLNVLIPDDDEPLPVRTLAIGAWCRGFLSGFGLGNATSVEQLSDDSQGFLRDIQQIGRVGVDEEDDDEDDGDEFALMEICEYARMGALLLCEESRISSGGGDPDDTVH